MFDAKDLLGKLIQTRMSGSSNERLTHAMARRAGTVRQSPWRSAGRAARQGRGRAER